MALPLKAIGHQLGKFLAKLHGHDAAQVEVPGVVVKDEPGWDVWVREARHHLQIACDGGFVLRDDEAVYQRLLEEPPAHVPVPVVVIHGDLAAEHILLDDHSTVTGVIDWSDACLEEFKACVDCFAVVVGTFLRARCHYSVPEAGTTRLEGPQNPH